MGVGATIRTCFIHLLLPGEVSGAYIAITYDSDRYIDYG